MDNESYSALYSLLNAVAASLDLTRVCLVTNAVAGEGLAGQAILAASDRPESPVGVEYKMALGDVAVDVIYRGNRLGQLVATGHQGVVEPQSLAPFADAVSFILGRAQAMAEEVRAAEESQVLRELSLQLGEPTDLEQMLASTLRGIRRLLNADYASIATIAADGTSRWVAMDGHLTDTYKHTVFPKGKGITSRIVSTGKPLTLEGIGLSDELPASEFPVHVAEGGVSVMSVPLMRGGVALGALIVGSRKPRQWREAEIQLASVLANGAAMAIEQVQTSSAERSQRAFLERVIENYPGVLMVMSSPEFRIVRANSQLNQLLPEPYRSGESVVGCTLRDLSTDWDERGEAFVTMFSQVLETGEPISFEQYLAESPYLGTTYWDWTIVPIDEPGGGLGQRLVMLVARDVTEVVLARQKERELADTVRARAEELDAVINQMADAVIIFDAAGRVARLNPACEQMLGLTVIDNAGPGEHPGLRGLYTLSGELYDLEQMPSALALKGETVVGAQVMVKREDREDLIISVSASPLTDPDGTITGAVAVLHDITQDKVAERLKDEFLSVVSHELRTPLSAIMGYSDLMLRGVQGGLNERQARALNAVRANADRLLGLINDLLDVSRLESGIVTINAQPVVLSDVILRTIAQTRILAMNAGISIRNEVPADDIPLLMADDTKLQQIIENLVTNAVKFTPPGGSIAIMASLSPLPANDPASLGLIESNGTPYAGTIGVPQSVIVTVSDTGTGLEGDQLARIWDRFYQVDTSAKRQSGGAGLGLAIVRNLVELHGGCVQASSPGANQGSSFNFTLPVAPVQDLPRVAAEPGGKHVSTRPTWGNAHRASTVLVAEDDADQREIICHLLELEGYEVVVASDGNEALELAAAIKPSAIALDVILPRADGWEVLNRLRNDPATKDIPVLIISVIDQQEFGRKLGVNEYLIKPLDPASLRAAVRRLIEARNGEGPTVEDGAAS